MTDMEQFSAAYYSDMSTDELQAEADALKVDTHGMTHTEIVNAVYNAELRRRHDEAAAEKAEEEARARESKNK